MKIKKIIITIALFLIMPNFINAINLQESSQQIIDWIKEIFSPFFSSVLGISQNDPYFPAYLLLLILIYIIVLTILKKIEFFENKGAINVIISIAISILSLRYLTKQEFVKGILLPYQTLGIAISVFLPFLIYFFFIEKSIKSRFGRIFGWILFASIFFSLWIRRSNELRTTNWIYGIVTILSIIAIFIDPQIQKYFLKTKIDNVKSSMLRKEYIKLMNELKEAIKAREAAKEGKDREGEKIASKRIEEIQKRLRELHSEMR